MTLTKAALAFLVVLSAGGAYWFFEAGGFQSADRDVAASSAADLDAATAEMKRGRHQRAQEIASEVLREAPQQAVAARLIIAESFTKQGELTKAVEEYDRLLQDASADRDQKKLAYQCAGEIYLQRGDARRAEKYFEEALKLDPYFPPAHNRLAFLLGLEGRRWESTPHLVELIKQDQFSPLHLLLLANPKQNIVVDDFLDRVKRFDPDYSLALIPEAKAAVEHGEFEEASALIDKLVEHAPEQVEVRMLQGELFFLRGDREAFVEWSRSLTLQQESHPSCWILRALLSRHEGNDRMAIRCFAEAFFRDPNNLEACQALAQLLTKVEERSEIIEYFKKRTALLNRLLENSHLLHRDQRDVRLMEEAFACCDWLERYWEAWGWCRAALAVDPTLEWAQTQKADIEKHLVYDLPQTIIFRNINEWKYDAYPLPEWRTPQQTPPLADGKEASFAFRELAEDLGLAFHYESGHQGDPADPKIGRRMFEVTGGGVAAIDYDLDLYPDLYFGQGAKTFNDPNFQPTSDRIFRNLSGRRFEDVTERAGIRELGYSQGVSAGDVNNDGFPDVYVGNLGDNRLMLNNGDGTFSVAASALPALTGVWTTSTAVADVNKDGVPDLYDVDYLQAEAYEQLCDNDDGYKRACNPRIFPAERDRLLLGKGDGTFSFASEALPRDADEGRGLGIVIADYFGSGELGIFIANDMTANNFYLPDSTAKELRFRDEALTRGLALDQRGRAQACMGVAFGDFDKNLQADLFVTNFFGDYNTLYLQDGELFSDLSHSSNLASLSYHMLGFGTQSFDAELDGDLDLFVANGHIDDFRFQGLPHRMRPQLFVNDGTGKFSEAEPAKLGSYFSRELLGRGVAKLDWNLDGMEDIVISHLEDPAVLLSNEGQSIGESLRLSFVGTKLARDAVGTTVQITDGDETRIGQLTAGSGYQASNEPVLHFTVMHGESASVRIRWPDGAEHDFRNLKAGGHYRIIEGREPLLMP